jgi:hypothetical protein
MPPTASAHERLAEALRAAHVAGRGVPSELEAVVRGYAAARRASGDQIERILVDVKALLRDHVGGDVDIFKHRVVGWTVAGYFAGAAKDSGTGGDVGR